MISPLMRSAAAGPALRAAVAALTVAAACEAPRPDAGLPDRDAAPEADAGTVRLDAGTADGPLEAEGTWLLFVQDRYCLFAAGAVQDFLVWSWYRLEMIHARPGAGPDEIYFRQRVKLCAQDQSPVPGGLVTYIPAAVTAAVPERLLDGYLLGDRPGAGYLSEELVETWGLADALGPDDPVPESVDSDLIVDQDGDGLPGVTLIIGTAGGNELCKVQIAQRTRYRLGGEVVSAARIEGSLWSEADKTVLGASLSLCEAENQLDFRSDGTRMILVRVDAGNGGPDLDADADGDVACAEIMAARDALLEAGVVVKDEPTRARCQ